MMTAEVNGDLLQYHYNVQWLRETKHFCISSVLGLFIGVSRGNIASDEVGEDIWCTWAVAMHSGIPTCEEKTMSMYPCHTSSWPKIHSNGLT